MGGKRRDGIARALLTRRRTLTEQVAGLKRQAANLELPATELKKIKKYLEKCEALRTDRYIDPQVHPEPEPHDEYL